MIDKELMDQICKDLLRLEFLEIPPPDVDQRRFVKSNGVIKGRRAAFIDVLISSEGYTLRFTPLGQYFRERSLKWKDHVEGIRAMDLFTEMFGASEYRTIFE